MSAVRHGVGRELDDDELFGEDAFALMHKSSGSSAVPHGGVARPMRELSASNTAGRPTKRLRASTESPVTSGRVVSNPGAIVEAPPLWVTIRSSHPKLPDTVQETISEFTLPGDEDLPRKIAGAPRLSSLACVASVSHINMTRSLDISYLADFHAFSLLTAARLSPDLLDKMERRNPTRVRLLDAVWATVVHRLFQIDVRPPSCESWRAVYEEKVAAEEERLRRARDRLRSGYALNSNKKVVTKLDGRRSMILEPKRRASHSSVPLTRMERLRLQARKDRRRSGR